MHTLLLYSTDAVLGNTFLRATADRYDVWCVATERWLLVTLAKHAVTAAIVDASSIVDPAECCWRLRLMHTHLPLVAVANDHDAYARVRLLQAGADAVVPRSCSLAGMLAPVQAKIRRAEDLDLTVPRLTIEEQIRCRHKLTRAAPL